MQTADTLSDYERERGKPLPSFNHGVIQMQTGAALMQPGYTVVSELALALDDWHGTPDLCVYPERPIDLR
jgi:hypothetical protein